MQTLDTLMHKLGVHNHPDWFQQIPLPNWPMPHQMGMAMKYPRNLRFMDASDPGCGKTFPAQIHGIFMAALGNKVVYTMPPALIVQFYREFSTFFPGIHNHLKIAHLNVSAMRKKKLITLWDQEGWPDILLISYDSFRQLNDSSSRKNIGNNMWRVRNTNLEGEPGEFSLSYFDDDGNPRYPNAQPYTPDGRKIRTKKGKGWAENNKQMKLFETGYHVMFFDEAHALCSTESIIGESVNEITKRLGDEVAVYLMTGTPIPTHLHDCYGIIQLINPDAYFSKFEFLRRHCIMKEMRIPLADGRTITKKVPKDYVDTDAIYEALWKNAHRVQKRDVIQMKEPVISEIPVSLAPAHAKLYKQVVNDRFAVLGDKVLAPESQSEMRHMALQLISCPEAFGFEGENELAKATKQLVETIAPSESRKIIIFAYYRRAMEKLREDYAHLNPSVVYGGVKDRQEQIDRFVEDPNSTLLIIQWISGGAGLNLQVASYIIFYECPTSPKDAKQAIARADRKGQLRMVNVYFMRVLRTLSDKNFKNLLKNEESNNRAIKDRHDLLHELLGNGVDQEAA